MRTKYSKRLVYISNKSMWIFIDIFILSCVSGVYEMKGLPVILHTKKQKKSIKGKEKEKRRQLTIFHKMLWFKITSNLLIGIRNIVTDMLANFLIKLSYEYVRFSAAASHCAHLTKKFLANLKICKISLEKIKFEVRIKGEPKSAAKNEAKGK